MFKLFDYTKWEVLEIYSFQGTKRCVQVRMNKRTGFKHFKVTNLTSGLDVCNIDITIDKINALTKPNEKTTL